MSIGSDTYPRDMIMNMRTASYMGKIMSHTYFAATRRRGVRGSHARRRDLGRPRRPRPPRAGRARRHHHHRSDRPQHAALRSGARSGQERRRMRRRRRRRNRDRRRQDGDGERHHSGRRFRQDQERRAGCRRAGLGDAAGLGPARPHRTRTPAPGAIRLPSDSARNGPFTPPARRRPRRPQPQCRCACRAASATSRRVRAGAAARARRRPRRRRRRGRHGCLDRFAS